MGAKDHENLLQELPKYSVGLAPYSTNSKSITWYADPTKVKEYLACGLPVIITRVPAFADEIEKNKAGIVIDYNEKELAEAMIKMLSKDAMYKKYKENALKLASKYDLEEIYYNALGNVIKWSWMEEGEKK